MTRRKKIILILGIALAVLLIIVLLARRFRQTLPASTGAAAPSSIGAEQKAYEEIVAAKAIADQDIDGLPDAVEAKLGTNPKDKDSDADGLTDYDETRIFLTNPLKADTYGLGHTDSWGVLNRKILPQGKTAK